MPKSTHPNSQGSRYGIATQPQQAACQYALDRAGSPNVCVKPRHEQGYGGLGRR